MSLDVQIDNKKEFEAITELIQPAVLADVVDKGMVENKFKPGTKQHKCYFVWIVAEQDKEGRNKRVFESFTVSLHEKARLRARIKELGKMPKEGESLSLESLIGTQRTLVLAEEDGDNGKKYFRVTATMKPTAVVEVPDDFKRKVDQTD
jgi:hypothetical protein